MFTFYLFSECWTCCFWHWGMDYIWQNISLRYHRFQSLCCCFLHVNYLWGDHSYCCRFWLHFNLEGNAIWYSGRKCHISLDLLTKITILSDWNLWVMFLLLSKFWWLLYILAGFAYVRYHIEWKKKKWTRRQLNLFFRLPQIFMKLQWFKQT